MRIMQGRMAGEGEAMKSWRRVFAETDVPNSMEGGNCYVWADGRICGRPATVESEAHGFPTCRGCDERAREK